ncbi:hypothetical protein BJX76DRAFT_361958 [Aspergillus varians]
MASAGNHRGDAAHYWASSKADLGDESQGDEFRQLKRDLIEQYGEANLRKSWLEVTAALAQEAETIASRGSSIIPVIDASLLNELPTETIEDIKHRGVVVIRNILSSEEAKSLQEQLDKYLRANVQDIAGSMARPKENPWLFNSFFSPVQHKVRTLPRNLQAQRFLNSLWTGYDPDEALPDPLIYADALRHRRPGGFSATVQPHIDAGSLDRWADDDYRRFYEPIFDGAPFAYDPFDVQKRILANQAKFPGRSQSTVFRTFQGWTALSSSGEEFGCSSLAVYPNLKLAQAYVLLRPFFKPPSDGVVADPSSWVLDESGSFPGSAKGLSQMVLAGTHPHLRLEETLTLTPRINPGDAIIHAVDPANNSDETATVLYIPAVPLTRNNVSYLKGQKAALLANAQTPPDFNVRGTSEEGHLTGWEHHSAAIGDNSEGRQAYGLERLQGSAGIVNWANQQLGYA